MSPTPLTRIAHLRPVDDAGGTHYETILTGQALFDLVDDKLLRLEGNIRPDWQDGARMRAKTRRKVDGWAEEYLRGDGVVGNLSIRLDVSDEEDVDFELDAEDSGTAESYTLSLFNGYFDTAIDSQSRITALLTAREKWAAASPDAMPIGERRFAVRIWFADDETSKRVGRSFNTEGDAVNASAAKSAYTAPLTTDALVRGMLYGSRHLLQGTENVEKMRDSVSASSNKLAAFNTFSKAMETAWPAPVSEQEQEEQIAFLVRYWDRLATTCPAFGVLSLEERKTYRGSSLAGSALSLYGALAIARAIWKSADRNDLSPLSRLTEPAHTGDGQTVDFFSYQNPDWTKIGALVSATTRGGDTRLTLRNSFQSRKAVSDCMLRKVGIAA